MQYVVPLTLLIIIFLLFLNLGIMTIVCSLLGLLPVMWSTNPGSEVMKRIAAPIVEGVFASGFLELLVYPAIFAIWKGLKIKER